MNSPSGAQKVFPTLFSKSTNGKITEWNISVTRQIDQSTITTSAGFTDGKKTTHTITVNKGKNIGKKNETDHFTQAIADAQSKWNTKAKKSVENIDNLNDLDNTFKCMLAHKYSDHNHKIKSPFYIQPKLDGYRALLFNGESLKTRQNTVIHNMQHIINDCVNVPQNIILDGELYVHGGDFENLGCIRKNQGETNSEDTSQIKYHVYDLFCIGNQTLSFDKRIELLNNLQFGPSVKVVQTTKHTDHKDITKMQEKHLEIGYEGTMVRNNSEYQQKRSYNLQKYKDFMDAEFEIVDYEKYEDNLGGGPLIKFICKTKEGKQFAVDPKGTKIERSQLLKQVQQNPNEWLHKKLCVKFFRYSKDGVPIFPKTLHSASSSIRDQVI